MATDHFTRMMRRRDIAWVAVIAFIAGVLMLFVAVDTLLRIADMRELQARTYRTGTIIRLVDHLLYETASAEANQRGYLLSHEKNDLTSFNAAISSARADSEKLVELSDNDEKDLAIKLQQRIGASLISLQTEIKNPPSKRDGEASNNDDAISNVRLILNAFRGQAENRLEIATTNVSLAENRAHLRATISISIAGLTMILAFIGAYIEGRIRRRITRRLQQERQSAIAANRTKSSFLAYTSHELRTPLNAIIGFSEFMMMEYAGPVSDRQKQYLSDIRSSGLHLQALIGDILDLTKAEAGKITLLEQPVDITALVASCLKLLEGQAKEAGVTLHSMLMADLPALRADELRCKQILINVAISAIQSTPAEGVISLTTFLTPQNEICLTVHNTGPGLAKEDIAKAIEPYYRSGIDEPSHKGFGLGLPLARKITELHDGTMTLTSEPSDGIRVSVVFPAERTLSGKNAVTVKSGDAEVILLHPKAKNRL